MSSAPHSVDMIVNTIYLQINGVHQDWKTYQFDLDRKTPGQKVSHFGVCLSKRHNSHLNHIKTFVFQIKEVMKRVPDTDMDTNTFLQSDLAENVTAQTFESNSDVLLPSQSKNVLVQTFESNSDASLQPESENKLKPSPDTDTNSFLKSDSEDVIVQPETFEFNTDSDALLQSKKESQ